MHARAPQRWTFDEYMAWEAEQPEKWEFVDGRPVLRSERWTYDRATGMAGPTRGHNRVTVNLLIALSQRLRGGPCEVFVSGLKVRSETGNARYPDVVVDCAPGPNDSLLSNRPTVLFEVLSDSNTFRNQSRLMADYQCMATVQHFVFLEQDRPGLVVWTRKAEGWGRSDLDGLDATLALPGITVDLPLSEIYAGMGFPPG